MAKKLKTVDDNGEIIEGVIDDEDEYEEYDEEGGEGEPVAAIGQSNGLHASAPEQAADVPAAVVKSEEAPAAPAVAEAVTVKAEPATAPPPTRATAPKPVAKTVVINRPASPAGKDAGPTRRSSRAGKKVDYGALNTNGKKVDYASMNGVEDEHTDDEDLLPAYDAGIDIDRGGGTRRSSRTRTGRKVVDYNQLMQGRREDYPPVGRDIRERDEFGRSKKEAASMRNKYQSIFLDGYRSDAEDFDYEIVNMKRNRTDTNGFASERDSYLMRKRGKYDIARSLLGDDTTDEEDDYD